MQKKAVTVKNPTSYPFLWSGICLSSKKEEISRSKNDYSALFVQKFMRF